MSNFNQLRWQFYVDDMQRAILSEKYFRQLVSMDEIITRLQDKRPRGMTDTEFRQVTTYLEFLHAGESVEIAREISGYVGRDDE